MTAARIARRLVRNTERRDLVGELLFWRLDWFEAHPLVCFAGIVMTIVLNGILEQI